MAKGAAMSADERIALPESGNGGQGAEAGIGAIKNGKDGLRQMLREAISDKPFSELSAVTFDQRGVALTVTVRLARLPSAERARSSTGPETAIGPA